MTGRFNSTIYKNRISTHTLTWSVTEYWNYFYKYDAFQLTRSRGAWHSQYHMASYLCHFNSHAHVERDSPVINNSIITNDFNSHAHVERDGRKWENCTWIYISTHTLTWSVTVISLSFFAISSFQLTRSRGAWPYHLALNYISGQFQLTRSRGAWHTT